MTLKMKNSLRLFSKRQPCIIAFMGKELVPFSFYSKYDAMRFRSQIIKLAARDPYRLSFCLL